MIYDIVNNRKKKLVILIDPDKHSNQSLEKTCKKVQNSIIDFIMVGGSLVNDKLDHAIMLIKQFTNKPVVLFPGSLFQLTNKVDAVLLLSLISGRNPEFLIGNHIHAAPYLKQSGVEVIPTGYMLLDGGNVTSVQYISNTMPIPQDKPELARATAMAGELLGLKQIYLEAGSGAKNCVCPGIIADVRKHIDIPIIVGGGIKSTEHIIETFSAGADVIVIGSAFEQNIEMLSALKKHSINQ